MIDITKYSLNSNLIITYEIKIKNKYIYFAAL